MIGSRARAWPIRDGKDQARLIATTVAASATELGNDGPTNGSISGSATSPTKAGQRRQTATKIHTQVCHFSHLARKMSRAQRTRVLEHRTSLHQGIITSFSPDRTEKMSVSPDQDHLIKRICQGISPQNPARDYHELFVGPESDASPVQKRRCNLPKREPATPSSVAPKAGSGKNYHPNRLFDQDREEDPTSPTKTDDVFKKPDPKKYNHFEFGDGDDVKTKKSRSHLALRQSISHNGTLKTL